MRLLQHWFEENQTAGGFVMQCSYLLVMSVEKKDEGIQPFGSPPISNVAMMLSPAFTPVVSTLIAEVP